MMTLKTRHRTNTPTQMLLNISLIKKIEKEGGDILISSTFTTAGLSPIKVELLLIICVRIAIELFGRDKTSFYSCLCERHCLLTNT